MNYILLHWSYGRTSMKMTVDAMTEPCNLLAKKNDGTWWEYGLELDGERNFEKRSPTEMGHILSDENNLINWGNHIFSNDKIFRLNRPSAIALASNKARSRRVLQEAGVAVPKTYFWENLGECLEVTYPIIVRPAYHHAGKNFDVFSEPTKLQAFLWGKHVGTWYASEVFEKTHEFRVHCAHGKILQISNKPLIEGEIRANQAVTEQAWKALKWSEYDSVLPVCVESLKAIEILGLDYGAVDIMWNANNETAAICEVNTSPSINTEYSSGKYAKYFDWVIRHDFPAHFPIEGKSVFYNKILES